VLQRSRRRAKRAMALTFGHRIVKGGVEPQRLKNNGKVCTHEPASIPQNIYTVTEAALRA
jgi:hypothetical protein